MKLSDLQFSQNWVFGFDIRLILGRVRETPFSEIAIRELKTLSNPAGFGATPFAGVTDPWQDYSARKKPPHPVVPEPGAYGVAFVALCLAVLVAHRWRNRGAKFSLCLESKSNRAGIDGAET